MLGLVAASETWHVYLVAALLTTATAYFSPTVQAVLPAVVPKDALLAANPVAWSTGRLVQIVASALAGGLITAVGTDAAFALNGLTFLFSAAMIARIAIPAHAGQLGAGSTRGLAGYLAFVPYLVRGVGDVLLAVFALLPVALVILFVYGLNTSTGVVVSNSLLQSQVPEGVRGRVYTLPDATWNLLRLVSLVAGGALAESLGVRAVYYLGGSLLFVAGHLGLLLFRPVRFRSRGACCAWVPWRTRDGRHAHDRRGGPPGRRDAQDAAPLRSAGALPPGPPRRPLDLALRGSVSVSSGVV